MKTVILMCSLMWAGGWSTVAAAQAEPAAPIAGPRLLVGGFGLPFIAAIGADGVEEWQIPAIGRHADVWLLESGNVLYTYGRGAREVRRDPAAPQGVTVVWDWKAIEGAEIDGCQPLPPNRVLVSQSQKGRIDLIEFERGTMTETARTTIIDPALSGAHGNCRQVRKTAQNTYLFGLMGGTAEGREYDATGKLLHRFPGVRYALQKLPDGTYLGAGGDNRCVMGFDADAKETWRINAEDVPGFGIGFAAAVQRLDDGSWLIANWGGHKPAKGPCIGRVSADRKSLLWSLKLNPSNRVAAFHVLPSPKAETKGP